MIANLKPYPAMKDSGVHWLGEVPEHWEVLPFGRYLRVKSGDMISSEDEREGGVPIYGGNGIRGYTFQANTHGPTILLGRVGAKCGCVHLVDGDFWASEHALRVLPQAEIDLKFLALALGHADLNRLAIRTAQPLINSTIVRTHRAAFPPLPEQAAIVRFLDHADRRIRHYIRAKQKLIKLLDEQKQGIIHGAVTRGLDPTVRLKPSGVEWLGDVPTHWDVVPNRALLRLEKRPVGKAWGDFLLLSLTKRGVIPRDMENPEGKFPTSFDTYQEVNPGDLMFCLFDIDETPRAVGLSTLHGMITGAYTRFSCDQSAVDWVYLFYLAMDNGKHLKPLYTGLRKVITKSAFLSAKLPLPPTPERTAILAHVENSTRVADWTIDRAQREIALLREYRTRLISDVVTGKLDVREAGARLPDEADEPEPLDEADPLTDAEEGAADDLEIVPEEAEA